MLAFGIASWDKAVSGGCHRVRRASAAVAVALALLLSACSGAPPATKRMPDNGASPSPGVAGSARAVFDRWLAQDPPPVVPDARELFDLALAEHGADLTGCIADRGEAGRSCQRPASLRRDLKAAVNVAIVLDASGSMNGRIGGRRKVDVARAAIARFARQLPAPAKVSVRVFGNAESRNVSCASLPQLVPFARNNPERIDTALSGVTAAGYSPLGRALQQVRRDFSDKPARTNSNFVYLVSDGEDSCGGNPVAAARALRGGDGDVQVNLVGVNVDTRAAAQLRATARAGNGSYAAGTDSTGLDRAFRQVGDWEAWTTYYNCRYGKTDLQDHLDQLAVREVRNCMSERVDAELDEFGRAEVGLVDSIQQARYAHLDRLDMRVDRVRDLDLRVQLAELFSQHRDAANDAVIEARLGYAQLLSERRDRLWRGIRQQEGDLLVQAEADRARAVARFEELRARVGVRPPRRGQASG